MNIRSDPKPQVGVTVIFNMTIKRIKKVLCCGEIKVN